MARAANPAQRAASSARRSLSPSRTGSTSLRHSRVPHPISSSPPPPTPPLSPASMSAARPHMQPFLPAAACPQAQPQPQHKHKQHHQSQAHQPSGRVRAQLPLPLPAAPATSARKSSCSAENGQIMGWLEAMKSASPPQAFSLGDYKFGLHRHDPAAAQYQAWTAKHPSALDFFHQLTAAAEGKEVAVFLDYDGTLSPIVEDPDKAYISDSMRAIVKDVAKLFPTAIISGRGREKVYEFVQLAELYYAGSHGMDIMGPAEGCNGYKAGGTRAKDRKGNEVVLFQPGSEFLPLMEEVCKLLIEKSKDIEGANVENNKFCATVHFRRVNEEKWGVLAERVQSVIKDFPTLCLTHGRKVLELRPSIEWDKGKAVEFLLKSLGLESSKDVLALYIGDDRTDEDAFNVLRERDNGYGILVSTVAKSTSAAYSLRDPSEVMDFLSRLVNWRRDRCQNHTEPCF